MIANQVCRMNFKQFSVLAAALECTPHKFRDHVGDNVYNKQYFYREGWRFVCDNVNLYIALPSTLGVARVTEPING